MLARSLVLLAFVSGCERTSPPSATSPAPAEPAPAPAANTPKTTTTRTAGGGCEPMPKVGEPCGEGDSWCVISWGEPGGFSSALWCRGGRWEREEEANLPKDEG